MDSGELKNAYISSAENLEVIRRDFESNGNTKSRREFYRLRYMAAIIMNDLSREYLSIETNPTNGTSKLLAVGTLILKLYEARQWYTKDGYVTLLDIADQKGIKSETEQKLRSLKGLKAGRIDAYSKFRNTIAGHYLFNSCELIEELEKIEQEVFFEDARAVLRYGNEWINVLKYVGEHT
ncbi:MAG: hypothetical protein OEZ43_07875 [Gammaproteobacteria bacterium]|nr:hypothetical protein [Gammaproteobacteria bacterium]